MDDLGDVVEGSMHLSALNIAEEACRKSVQVQHWAMHKLGSDLI